MAVELLRHADRGLIRKFEWIVTADGQGRVDPFDLPSVEGVLIALETLPRPLAPVAPFDVTLEDVNNGAYDLLEGVGGGRHPDRPHYSFIRYRGQAHAHPTFARCDALRLKLAGLTAGATVKVILFYGSGELAGR